MFNTLASWWYPPIKTISNVATLPSFEHPLTKLIQDKVNLNTLPEPVLLNLQENLHQIKVSKDHPLLQEINQRLSHKASPILCEQPFSKKILSTVSVAFPDHFFIQKRPTTIEETQNALEALTGNLDSIQLYDLNDELLIFIAQKFPQLKSLKIENTITYLEFFTDRGLRVIANLQHLESLTLDSWNGMLNISSEGLTAFFCAPSFVNRLKELKIGSFYFLDKAVSVLVQYRSLKTLEISAAALKEEGLYNLFKSEFLKKNLTHLTIFNSSPGIFTDTTLSKLKDFGSLEYLTLSEGFQNTWKVSDSVVVAFLEAQKKLKRLDIRCGTINGPMAEKIGQMSQMEVLRLDDCSQISSKEEWELLFSNKEKLTSLTIQKAENLDQDSILFVGNLSLTFLSIVMTERGYVSLKWMQNLCTSPTLKAHLKTLQLTEFIDTKLEGWKYLLELKNLSSLRLNRCRWFNTDAIKSLLALSKSLQTLELVGCSIDDNAISLMTQFKNLKNLLLGNCYALNKEGYDTLITTSFFQNNLEVFGTEQFDWTFDQLKKLTQFKKLKRFILSNTPLGLDEDNELFHIAKEKGFSLYSSTGRTNFFEEFEERIE